MKANALFKNTTVAIVLSPANQKLIFSHAQSNMAFSFKRNQFCVTLFHSNELLGDMQNPKSGD
jgi:hypothetical protein